MPDTSNVVAFEPVAAVPPDSIVIGRDVKLAAPVGLRLPEVLAGRLLIQGNPNAGKSWLLRRILEESHGRVQQLVIDPEGEFSSLAEALEYVTITAAAVARIGGGTFATHVRQLGYSAILDLSEATSEERMQLVAEICAGLVETEPALWRPLIVAIDEAQSLAPHYDAGDVVADVRKRATAAIADLMTRGRKRGLSGVIVTQRIAETAKSVVSKATTYIIGRTVFDRDLARSAGCLGLTVGRAAALRRLDDGEFAGLGPALGPRMVRFRVAPTRTRHMGVTPELQAPAAISADEARALLDELPTAERTAEPEADAARGGRQLDPGLVATLHAALDDGRTLADVANETGFTYDHVCRTARVLGLDFMARHRWTAREIEIVRGGSERGLDKRDIVAALREAGFERSLPALQNCLFKLGLTQRKSETLWTDSEKAIVRAGYEAGKTRPEIVADLAAAGFGRTTSAIGWIAGELGLNKAPPPWSAEEERTLRELFGQGLKPRDIAARMGRPLGGVHERCHRLGLHFRQPWSDDERKRLVEAAERGERLVDVAAELKRNYANVAKIAEKMGLSFRRPAGPGYRHGNRP